MIRNQLKVFLFLVLIAGTYSTLQAEEKKSPSLTILGGDELIKATYVSAEYDEGKPLPYWVVEGQVVPTAQAADSMRAGGLVCTLWALDYTEQRGQTDKVQIKIGAIKSSPLTLWQDTGYGRIYLNSETDFALSYVCVQKNKSNEVVEAHFLSLDELNRVFQGLAVFQ